MPKKSSAPRPSSNPSKWFVFIFLLLSFSWIGIWNKFTLSSKSPFSDSNRLKDAARHSFRALSNFDAHEQLSIDNCVEVLASDRPSVQEKAKLSINSPPSPCKTVILQRATQASTWRRSTWSKIDVLVQNRSEIEGFHYVLVRDIDTKVNTTHILRMLSSYPRKTFVVGYRREIPSVDSYACNELIAVTNWFAFNNIHDEVHKKWQSIRIPERRQTDQHLLNEKFKPCCARDILCVDKCVKEVNEIHCRRLYNLNRMKYNISQEECIANQTKRTPSNYNPELTYTCPDRDEE